MTPAYRYRAIATKIYDGDTITVDVDLGFHTWQKSIKLRLIGINTPELRGPERLKGIDSRNKLIEAWKGGKVSSKVESFVVFVLQCHL
ncbi:MAG: hypothetical protein AAGD25_06925 [Cyanobacteria bacterium P01_F01_bin.150]